jgi:serine/threonine protein kinase
MSAAVCPRCQELYAGSVISGDWLTCRACQHRWLPVASAAETAPRSATPPPLPIMGHGDIPLPPVPIGPPKVKSNEEKRKKDSDEYAPDETGNRRTVALTNRRVSDASSESSDVAREATKGTDPFDPGMFDQMAREAKSERTSKAKTDSKTKERIVTPRGINCPVCGHGFSSNKPNDTPQNCPQCHTSFNLAKGHVTSGSGQMTGGDILLGRVLRGCLIDRKIGEGGMGTVYHARQLSLDRSVAIKVLPVELARNRNFITRFEREAKSLAKINHPNILHIYDFGDDPQLGIYFMIIEFVQGRDLGDMLQESYTLGQVEVLDIVRQAAMGLEMAANKGVIHRDIKPDNLMLTEEGICKVSDFGLAKGNGAEKDVTSIGVRVGTPAFMSPEQCDGEDVDYRSDVYNLGCTAFLALTGQLPYDADTPFAIMLKHKNDPVPSPRSYNPNLDPRVDKLVMRMIAKRPSDRCDSLRDLVQYVEELEVKLAGTSTVLRKTHGPFRAMSDMDAAEHAKMTSTGIKRPSAEVLNTNRPNSIPAAKAVSTPAPLGESAVPDWLKPVDSPKPRKTTSNLDPMPTPRPAPQIGTTTQPALKDLRTKLAEAKYRNIQDEVETLRIEGERLSASGQTELAADKWMRAAALTPNAHESQELITKATKSRRSFNWIRFMSRLLIVALLLAGLGAGGFYGVPVGHNLIAEQAYAPIQAISLPTARLQALEQFIHAYGKPLAWYTQIFKQNYIVISADRAQNDLTALKLQLMPPKKVEAPKPSKADEEIKQLEALRDDLNTPWMAVAAEARRVVEQGEAKDRARPILAQAEQQLATMASDFEVIRKEWAAGNQAHVATLAENFRKVHPRSGKAAPTALLGRLIVLDNFTQQVPAGLRIITKAQIESQSVVPGVIPGEAVLHPGEFDFCRYPNVAVQLDVSAPGYRTERIQIAANPDEAILTVSVNMVPGIIWHSDITNSPRWMRLQSLAEAENVGLVRTPDKIALINFQTGKTFSPVTREQVKVPIPSTAQNPVWSDAWDANGKSWSAGTTDGVVVALSVNPQQILVKELLYRGTNPVLAFRAKELTFQTGAQANYAVTTSDQGMLLKARTKEKDLWSSAILSGFQRPILWFIDDHLVAVDDKSITIFDEADGRVVIQTPLPGPRSGSIETLAQAQALLVPTMQGAGLYRVQAQAISPINDSALAEAGGRLINKSGNLVVCVSGDRDVTLLNWTETQFKKEWRTTIAEEMRMITTVSCQAGVILIADNQGSIYVLAQADGHLLRRINHPALILDAPLLVQNQLIIADRDGRVTAYHLPGLSFP